MSEYIKTDDIVKSINVLLDNVDASEDAMHKFCDSMNDIQKVEIVRCGDCKHCEIRNNDEPICHFREEIVEANEFCSFGEAGRWTP